MKRVRRENVVILIKDDLTHDSRLDKQCRTLCRAGYDVNVFGAQDRACQLESHFRKDGCNFHRPDWQPANRWLREACWNYQAVRFTVGQRPAVILNHRWRALLAANLAARSTGAGIVYDNRELFGGSAFDRRSILYRQTFWLFERIMSRGCFEVIMASHGRADAWRRKYRCRKPRVVYDCEERNASVTNSDKLRREYDLGPRDKLLLYIGAMGDGRGLVPCLGALKKLPAAYHFVTMGYGAKYVDLLRDKAKEMGVSDRFHVHPPVLPEDVTSCVTAADLTLCLMQPVSRSYIESVPQKFYQSLNAGVPVLTSNFPEISRLVMKHRVGASVPPEDIGAICTAILELTSGRVSRAEWEVRCKAAGQAMTWENEAEQLLEAVRGAIQLHMARRPT